MYVNVPEVGQYSLFVKFERYYNKDSLILNRLITIMMWSLFINCLLKTDEIQCKESSRALRIKRISFVRIALTCCSQCVHRFICAHVSTPFAFCVRSLFIVQNWSPNSVLRATTVFWAVHALTVFRITVYFNNSVNPLINRVSFAWFNQSISSIRRILTHNYNRFNAKPEGHVE